MEKDKKKKIVLLGCGGHARSVVDTILQTQKYQIAGFTDLECNRNFSYRGIKYLGQDDVLQDLYDAGVEYAFVCVGYMGHGDLRNCMYKKLKNIGFKIPVIIDKTAVLADDCTIGEGTFVGKRAIINANSHIGKMCIINSAAVIEHDCVVSDFTHISVGSVICGTCRIGESSLIGANATIIQGSLIGDRCVVGAGTVIIHSVESGRRVVGVPGKILD